MKTLTKLSLSLLAVIAFAISANAAITFEDNYTVITGGGGINYEYNNGIRQSGSVAPLQYVVWSDVPAALPYVTNAGPTAGELYMPSDGSGWGTQSRWSPNYNFTESGDFSVEAIFNRTGDASWKSLNICKDAVLGSVFDSPGFSIMLFPDGQYYIRDGSIVTSGFLYAELAYASNPVLKVKFVVSQPGGFPSIGDALVSLFINDKPYPLRSTPNQFTYTHTGGFTNNYISVFADGSIGVDNLKVTTSDGNAIATSLLTDDADSGIDNSKVYTHAVNLADVADVIINGQTFVAAGLTAMSGSNWEIRTADNNPLTMLSFPLYGIEANVSPSSKYLITNVLYSTSFDNAGSLTLTGLTPNQQYILTLYSMAYGNIGDRRSYLATSDGDIITDIDQNNVGNLNGQLLTYQYTANANGIFSISTTPISDTWGFYAFSNEEVIPEPIFLGVIALLGLAFLRRK